MLNFCLCQQHFMISAYGDLSIWLPYGCDGYNCVPVVHTDKAYHLDQYVCPVTTCLPVSFATSFMPKQQSVVLAYSKEGNDIGYQITDYGMLYSKRPKYANHTM